MDLSEQSHPAGVTALHRPMLSVIIPVYNEAPSIERVIERVRATGLADEIIVVDDGSTDDTSDCLSSQTNSCDLKLVRHHGNRGKGAAIRTGLEHAAGEFVIIQDADLEYDPADCAALLAPLKDGRSNVVYGARRNDTPRRGPVLFIGVKLLTLVANVLYGCHLHDEATGYKAFRLSLLRKIRLECEGFDFCPEVTAKVRRLGERIVEVPVSYYPRTIAAGKKLRWTHGLSALITLFRYRIQSRSRFDLGHAAQAANSPVLVD